MMGRVKSTVKKIKRVIKEEGFLSLCIKTLVYIKEKKFADKSLSPSVLFDHENKKNRINLLLETLDNPKALIFGITLANRLQAPLRIITRTVCSPSIISTVLSTNHLVFLAQPEFHVISETLLVSKKDIFVVTSAWSEQYIKSINMRKKYLFVPVDGIVSEQMVLDIERNVI